MQPVGPGAAAFKRGVLANFFNNMQWFLNNLYFGCRSIPVTKLSKIHCEHSNLIGEGLFGD